jgi:hypothetical protein
MWQQIVMFFNLPFFIVLGGVATLSTLVGIIVIIFLVIKGIFPVWYRLGMGLSRRKIMVFAESEFDDLQSMLVDSRLFQKKNIIRIEKKSLKKAESSSLLLVHWKPFEKEMEDILKLKRDNAALIIYAPQSEGFIDKGTLEKINMERNAIVVNFRGRLLNDILTSMITTGYE